MWHLTWGTCFEKVQLQVLRSTKVVVLPGVCVCMCVCVCVFNHGGFPSILMVIGALEWSFCSGTLRPLWGSGARLHTDNGLVVEWEALCEPPCVSAGCACVCLLLKWFEESYKQQVGDASSSSPLSPSLSFLYDAVKTFWFEFEVFSYRVWFLFFFYTWALMRDLMSHDRTNLHGAFSLTELDLLYF